MNILYHNLVDIWKSVQIETVNPPTFANNVALVFCARGYVNGKKGLTLHSPAARIIGEKFPQASMYMAKAIVANRDYREKELYHLAKWGRLFALQTGIKWQGRPSTTIFKESLNVLAYEAFNNPSIHYHVYGINWDYLGRYVQDNEEIAFCNNINIWRR